MAVKNTGKMQIASSWVAVGMISMLLTWLLFALLNSDDIPFFLQDIVTLAFGSLSLGGFNIGFFIMAYGVNIPGGLNKALLEYYQSKHICIVHRGAIKGKLYMCEQCSVFYCLKCKEAIAKAENQCWNCKSPLENIIEPDVEIIAEAEGVEKSGELKIKFRTKKEETAGPSRITGESNTAVNEKPQEHKKKS